MSRTPKACDICGKPNQPLHIHCPRCKRLIGCRLKKYRIIALKAAWRPELDGFVCYYTGIVLNEMDMQNPWFLTYDHYIPGLDSSLVVSAAFINLMKSALSGDEFKVIVMEYDRHRKGLPFRRDVVTFDYWNKKAKPEPAPAKAARPLKNIKVSACRICGHEPRHMSAYCARCKRRWPNIPGHLAAMKNAWCKEQDGFLDHYIAIKMEEADLGSPYYMVFDHRIPGKYADLVVTSMLMNSLKSALSEEEFNLVMNELARHFEGQPFNKGIIEFAYWKGWG